jgi:hypothetical protein
MPHEVTREMIRDVVGGPFLLFRYLLDRFSWGMLESPELKQTGGLPLVAVGEPFLLMAGDARRKAVIQPAPPEGGKVMFHLGVYEGA